MFKIGLHDPFGHLKHKLWPKETRESTRSPCVQVACNIPLESSQRGIQLCFRPHLNRRFAHKVMGPQSWDSPKVVGVPTLGISGQNDIWMWASWRGTKYIIRGKVVASPKSRPWWVLWVQVCLWFVLASKVFQLIMVKTIGY
jgi:hypothetical protein